MPKSSQTFPYTSQRSAYISIISAMLFMALIEESVIILLIAIFIHNNPIKLALFGLIATLDLLILSKTLSPLWTHHTLNETHLKLQYGIDFKANLPRTAILSAQPVQEKLGIIPATKYEAAKHRIIVAFSEKGQLLLTLDQSYPFRVGLFSRKNADHILINVDQREQFLAALGLPPHLIHHPKCYQPRNP